MPVNIPESDWKKLKSLKEINLQRACERILERIEKVAESRGGQSYKAYLEIWKIMEHEDTQISKMFDDLKRSTALFKLALWRANGVITEEELSQFTKETRDKILFLSGA